MKWKLEQQGLIALSIIITLVITITAWSMIERFEPDARTQLNQYLTTQLNTTHQGVTSWFKEHQAAVQIWANTTEVKQAAIALLDESRERPSLLGSPVQTRLRGWLRPVLVKIGKVVAPFAFRINPVDVFTRIIKQGLPNDMILKILNIAT